MATKTLTTEQKVEKIIRDNLLYAGGILTLILHQYDPPQHDFTYNIKVKEVTRQGLEELYKILKRNFGELKFSYRILPCQYYSKEYINIVLNITFWTGLPF